MKPYPFWELNHLTVPSDIASFSMQSGDPRHVDRNAFHIGSTEVRRGRIGKVRETHAEKRRSLYMGALAWYCQGSWLGNQGPKLACCSTRPPEDRASDI